MKRLLLASLVLTAALGAEAQQAGFTRPYGPVQPASQRLQTEVGYEPKLGQSLPLDAMLTDETGATAVMLDPLEGLAPDSTSDYVSVMEANLATLMKGQNCG